MSGRIWRIGFANLDEVSPFAIAVRESLQEAARQANDVELIIRDNNLNDERALQNVRDFVDEQVDLAIIFHINQRLGPQFKSVLGTTSIIAVDMPILLTTYFGIDNECIGAMAGNALVEWIDRYWNGQVEKVLALVDRRVLESSCARTLHAVDVLVEHFPHLLDAKFYVDCGNTYETTQSVTQDVLKSWKDFHHIAVVGFNEVSTMGVIDMVNQLGMADQVAIVGHAASNLLRKELKKPDTRVIAATACYPEKYGPGLIDLAHRILNGERVPSRNYTQMELLLTERYQR
jgi:ABC-type sugar transport system substrate-binding protein